MNPLLIMWQLSWMVMVAGELKNKNSRNAGHRAGLNNSRKNN